MLKRSMSTRAMLTWFLRHYLIHSSHWYISSWLNNCEKCIFCKCHNFAAQTSTINALLKYIQFDRSNFVRYEIASCISLNRKVITVPRRVAFLVLQRSTTVLAQILGSICTEIIMTYHNYATSLNKNIKSAKN